MICDRLDMLLIEQNLNPERARYLPREEYHSVLKQYKNVLKQKRKDPENVRHGR